MSLYDNFQTLIQTKYCILFTPVLQYLCIIHCFFTHRSLARLSNQNCIVTTDNRQKYLSQIIFCHTLLLYPSHVNICFEVVGFSKELASMDLGVTIHDRKQYRIASEACLIVIAIPFDVSKWHFKGKIFLEQEMVLDRHTVTKRFNQIMQLKSSGGETTGKVIRKKLQTKRLTQPREQSGRISKRVSIILHRDKSCFRPCYPTRAQSLTWSGHMVSEKLLAQFLGN